ncbi:hypothetical protein [Acinetobacter sp.]|uniref:hypothetical protein n=1 Tax=Acinetobacter sp. TaxID=472 RepID=UPI002FC9D98F
MAIQFISFGEAILKRIAGFRSGRSAIELKKRQKMLNADQSRASGINASAFWRFTAQAERFKSEVQAVLPLCCRFALQCKQSSG